jgi:hypothetical protein
MSTQNHRAGGKYCGSHTTIISAATLMTDFASTLDAVTKIHLGFIKAGLPSVSGDRRVKFTDDNGSILLKVRDNTSHQEVRIYTSNIQETRTSLAREARNQHLNISFMGE